MIDKETLENNKLIAEFMGARYNQIFGVWTSDIIPLNNYGNPSSTQQLKYHKSWDWLMPLVEKIEKLTNELPTLTLSKPFADSYVVKLSSEVPEGEDKNRLTATYKAVVEFIKWHNENK